MTNEAIQDEIRSFWFSERAKERWFDSTPAFDHEILNRFGYWVEMALAEKLADWEETATSSLVKVILLDQFPLNIYRGTTKSFSGEQLAVQVSLSAVENGFDQMLNDDEKGFLYLPFMHSENVQDQERATSLFTEANLQDYISFAQHHANIIKQFGRFPHRNAILGRKSTAAELEYLASSDAFHG